MVVTEIYPEGGAATEGSLRVGDRIRGVVAKNMAMTYPTWQLALGGVGRPKEVRVLARVDGKPLDYVVAAIRSNADRDGEGVVTLVVERLPE